MQRRHPRPSTLANGQAVVQLGEQALRPASNAGGKASRSARPAPTAAADRFASSAWTPVLSPRISPSTSPNSAARTSWATSSRNASTKASFCGSPISEVLTSAMLVRTNAIRGMPACPALRNSRCVIDKLSGLPSAGK